MTARLLVRNHDLGGKIEIIDRDSPKAILITAIGLYDAFQTTNGKIEPIRVFLDWHPKEIGGINSADWAGDCEGRDELVNLLRQCSGLPPPAKQMPSYPGWGEF